MKNFDELTDDELLAMTPDAIQRYIDRECAEAGIPILESPGAAPDTTAIQGDMKVCVVAGLYFGNRQDALNVRDALRSAKSRLDLSYVSGPSYLKKATPASDELDITETDVLSEDAASKRAASIADAERAKIEWVNRKNAYEAAGYKKRAITDEINARVQAVRAGRQQQAVVRRQFERYLELADGNRRTASRFLLAAVPDARNQCPDLFEFAPTDPPDVPLSSKRFYQPNEKDAPAAVVEEDIPL